jgi:hypothetical protein
VHVALDAVIALEGGGEEGGRDVEALCEVKEGGHACCDGEGE